MKKTLSTLLSLSVILMTNAQNDSIPEIHELQEITVEAKNQILTATSSTYFPSKRQKDSSSDAVTLLGQMAIPQIDVNPASKSVKTVAGKDISIFIDYVKATPQDLEGMLTADVKRVEYLLYPQDARFHGAQYVINFIMQKYEWGGYTKLNADQSIAVNMTNASLYSKFVFKDMIFDLYADESRSVSNHIGSSSEEKFKFTDLYGEGPCDVERYSTPISSRLEENVNNVSFRAMYSKGSTQISNSLSFRIGNKPHDDAGALLTYVGHTLADSSSQTYISETNRTVDYNFTLYRTLNPKMSFYVSAEYVYGHNNSDSKYIEKDLQIVNDASEDSHYAVVSPQLTWRINNRQSLIAYMFNEYSCNKVDYYGNSPSNQKYDLVGLLAGARYAYTREKWSAGTQFGWVYAYNRLGRDMESNDTYPKGNVFASYAPDQKNQFELSYGFGKNIPGIYMRSQNMLRQDALMWYEGNPHLSNYWDNGVWLTYTWLPSNQWQLNAMSEYFISSNRLVATYNPDGPDGTMLRSYVNDGDFRRIRFSMSATGKFMNGRLVAKFNPQVYLQSTTGEYAMRKNMLTGTAQLTWYFGNFHLFGWYSTPSTFPEVKSGASTHTPSQYQLRLGWSKGNWNVSVSAYNFLRTNWVTSRQILQGRYYQFDNENHGYAMHQRFQASVSYTFNYGKKVQTGNEVGASSGSQSAILK